MNMLKVSIVAFGATLTLATTPVSVLENEIRSNVMSTHRRLAPKARKAKKHATVWNDQNMLDEVFFNEGKDCYWVNRKCRAPPQNKQQLNQRSTTQNQRLQKSQREEMLRRKAELERKNLAQYQRVLKEQLRKERVQKVNDNINCLANKHFEMMKQQRKWLDNFTYTKTSDKKPTYTNKSFVLPEDQGERQTVKEVEQMMRELARKTHAATPKPTRMISVDDLLKYWVKEKIDVQPTTTSLNEYATKKRFTVNINNISQAKLLKKWNKHVKQMKTVKKIKTEKAQVQSSKIEAIIKASSKSRSVKHVLSKNAEIANSKTVEAIMNTFYKNYKRVPTAMELITHTNWLDLKIADQLHHRFPTASKHIKNFKKNGGMSL